MSFTMDWFLCFGAFMAALGFMFGAYIDKIGNLIGVNEAKP